MKITQTSPLPSPAKKQGYWANGRLPENVSAGLGTVITDDLAFKRFHSCNERAVTIGANCTMDGVHFDLGRQGKLEIGDHCFFTSVVLLCELEIRIGNYVVIGWNATIADSDFHPIAPTERIIDAIACSPLGRNQHRPEILRKPIVIEDDVWIGPNATILKGVRIGQGAFVEPGSLITRDVPAGARVMGNPARIVGKTS